MKKAIVVLAVLLLVGAGLSVNVQAAEATAAVKQATAGGTIFFSVSVAAAAFCIAFAAAFCALAQGRAIDKSMESLARQPEISGDLRTNLIIGLALIESLCIYALVIAILLIYVNPFQGFFLQG